MKLEIGGGSINGKYRGEEWTNLDLLAGADIIHDLNNGYLPFADDSVDEVYSAHCLEHVKDPHKIVGEMLRISKVGSVIELRFPHWLHPMAMCPGHLHVISDRQIHIWCSNSQYFDWPKNKAIQLIGRIEYIPDVAFESFKSAFLGLHPDFILMNMPGCCHEIRVKMIVISR